MSGPVRIACLHSAAMNEPVFRAEAARLPDGCIVTHDTGAVPHLIAAEAAGGLTDEIAGATAVLLERLAATSDVVLLTCSTLGPAAAIAAERTGKPVLRVDAALARAAVAAGRRILVLYAVETTLAPTRALFEQAAAGRDVEIDYRLVEGAWGRMRAGDVAGYHGTIAEAADRAQSGMSGPVYDVVALAQASMSGAAALTRIARPLTSPAAGLAAAVTCAGNR